MEKLTLSRRAFLNGTTLLLGGGTNLVAGAPKSALVRLGLFTDVHYADKPEWRSRFYRESLTKLREGLSVFSNSRIDFLVGLGDLVDAAENLELERKWVAQATDAIHETKIPCHLVLGNHCVQTLTKKQFLSEVQQQRSQYSFDQAGVHFIILDACYRKDGVSYDAGNFDWKDTEIPRESRAWLKQDLAAASGPSVVFVHQRLDVSGVHAVANARDVRSILENSGKVGAVFQGHSHQNDYREINGIHYCTMRAVIEGSGAANSGYSQVTVFAGGALKVEGFREQRNYDFSAA